VSGKTRVFAKTTIEPARLKTLIRLVWQPVRGVDRGGILLIAAPSMDRSRLGTGSL